MSAFGTAIGCNVGPVICFVFFSCWGFTCSPTSYLRDAMEYIDPPKAYFCQTSASRHATTAIMMRDGGPGLSLV
jgi:hypothetical protein